MDKMDLGVLDEIIGKCEQSMIHPFSKKREEASKKETKERRGGLRSEDAELLAQMYSSIKD